jgi:hypothetical protein
VARDEVQPAIALNDRAVLITKQHVTIQLAQPVERCCCQWQSPCINLAVAISDAIEVKYG